MPLGYRGIFEIDAATDVIHLAAQEFRSWLRSQPWADTSDWEGVGHFPTGPDSALTVLEHSADEGRRLLRLRSTSRNNGLQWTTTLTAVAGARKSAGTNLVWIDVRSDELPGGAAPPARKTASVPRLARHILESAIARDGLAEIAAQPQIVRGTVPLEVERLFDVITDGTRHIGVVVAGAVPGASVERWRDTVAKLLRESVGLHAGYVLDEAAFEALNARLPEGHRVPVAGLRTFLPGVNPDDPLDGRRHRVLSSQAINAGFDGRRVSQRLQWALGHAVRAHAMERALPRDIRRADRILNALETDTVLASLDVTERGPLPAGQPQPTAAARVPAPAPEDQPGPRTDETRPAPAAAPEPPSAPDPDHLAALRGLLTEVLGTGDVTAEAVGELRQVVRSARTAELRATKLREQLEEMRQQVYELQDEREALKKEVEDAQTDHAAAEEELRAAHDRVRWLRQQLIELKAADTAWSPVPDAERTIAPASFDDVLLFLEKGQDLPHIRFTGDPQATLDLLPRDPLGTWAAKAWEALLALNDYADYRANGNPCEGVHAYLKQTPAGRRGYSANRHAATESQTVQSNSKWHRQRTLPVPEEVVAGGRVFMGAHFKISSSNTVSPRIHYYDDTAGTGRIYVGYLGRHLENTQS
ncbi:hypothetical protein [Marinitenerispora sediminis]|uniref:Uncharacterized protein n=1 Tax=Marinitenerispora sediminis TaxID=1931232 RepID=A0A368SYT0_9ACTN|nr:hypothetical protein [Marinitenerispora sediminis]RCV47790.1 hypothetical protein DEF28_25330 [Marinitenerispora sediminis]RCV48439.1 hypothetical protein DEF23_25010 [Marinitenerispora sediminis]RCV50004.1 hypothetical protein DEF24_24690 [Marinitenerispora sediminis]